METRSISLSQVEPSHTEFLLKLFTECRPDLDSIMNVSREQKESIIYQQFALEHHQLIQMYPEAELNIVMIDKEPVGRVYINYGVAKDRILQIGLLKKYRGFGIGRKIVAMVIDKAFNKRKTVSLQVAWFNQGAYGFYEKLGFKVIENNGVFYEMENM